MNPTLKTTVTSRYKKRNRPREADGVTLSAEALLEEPMRNATNSFRSPRSSARWILKSGRSLRIRNVIPFLKREFMEVLKTWAGIVCPFSGGSRITQHQMPSCLLGFFESLYLLIHIFQGMGCVQIRNFDKKLYKMFKISSLCPLIILTKGDTMINNMVLSREIEWIGY